MRACFLLADTARRLLRQEFVCGVGVDELSEVILGMISKPEGMLSSLNNTCTFVGATSVLGSLEFLHYCNAKLLTTRSKSESHNNTW